MPKKAQLRALHASTADGSKHVVCIENLRVVITQRDDCWFAQGLEIDYAAEGNDLDDVRRAFEYGLATTIATNLREFGSIEHMLRPAPEKAWRPVKAGAVRRYSQMSAHIFPFRIEFLEAA